MNTSGKLTVALILSVMFGLGIRSPAANPRVSVLFQQLQSYVTTDRACDQLFQLAASDPVARAYLAKHLPRVIDLGPKHYQPSPNASVLWPDPVWLNAVSLADELKLAEAAPALARFIGVSTGGAGTLGEAASLDNSPAGTALVHMGDAAIPALQTLLKSAQLDERREAAQVLLLIGSPKAKAALREHLPHESDNSLAAAIRKDLRR